MVAVDRNQHRGHGICVVVVASFRFVLYDSCAVSSLYASGGLLSVRRVMRDYVWVLGLHFAYGFIHLCTSGG